MKRMKTTKKLLGVVLALAIVVGCVAMAFTSFAANTTIGELTSTATNVEPGKVIDLAIICKETTIAQFSGVWECEPAGAVTFSDITLSSKTNGQYAVTETEVGSTQFTGMTGNCVFDADEVMVKATATVADAETLGDATEVVIKFTTNAGDCSPESGTAYDPEAIVTSLTLPIAKPATSITLASTETVTLNKGATISVAATIGPDGYNDGAKAVWSSSDTAVATVAEDGTVTAVGNGEATITAALSTNAAVTASYKVTVKTASTNFDTDVAVNEALKLVDDQYTIAFDGKFTATDIASMFTNKSGVSDFSVEVALADGEAVELDNGVISFKGVGEATLNVTVKAYDGASVDALATKVVKVTVSAVLPTSDNVVVTGDTALTVGGEGQMTVAAPANATDLTITDVKYTSSDASIVSVDETGAFKALKEGEATLTYSAKNANGDDITATLTVTVSAQADNGGNNGGDNGSNNGGNNGGTNGGNQGGIGGGNTGDAGVALTATLSLAAAAAFVFSKKRG